MSVTSNFRERFIRGDLLIGTFIKTPSPHIVEILGGMEFDFVVIDAEHAPFDRRSIDAALLAARAVGIPAIVRTADQSPAHLLAALDDGAAGVLAPHISSVALARELVAACRYSGKRGYSNSPRAGGFGSKSMWDHVDASDAEMTVIAMIEDMSAIDAIEEILAVEGLDGIFVGRADLFVSLGARTDRDTRCNDATLRVIETARCAKKPVMLFVADASEAQEWREAAVTAFVVSSDQGLMKAAARQMLGEFDKARHI